MKFIPKSHGTVVAYLALLVALGGTAQAVSPGLFSLGKSNVETTTTSLANKASGRTLNLSASHNTPLSLTAPAGMAPLIVNNSTLIPKLNAGLLGGFHASDFQARLSGACPTGIASADAAGALICVTPAAAATRAFATPGTGSFVVPDGVHSIVAEIWGGGGGGSGYCSYAYPGHIWGGGAGGYVKVLLSVNPGDVLPYVIGTGGQHGFPYSSPGQIGGDSSLDLNMTTVAVAHGGSGGADDALAAAGGQGGDYAVSSPAVGLLGLVGTSGNVNTGGGADGFAGNGGSQGGTGCSVREGGNGLIVLHLSS